MQNRATNPADTFIARWRGVNASELSSSQTFLADLCRVLDVQVPHPTPEQDYMFERPITFSHGDGSTSPGRIDLYRRGAFVLESKKLKVATQTKGFDEAMRRARSQAENYARALPASEGRPPFIIVSDVGNRIELYSEFSRSGATYTPFPDPRSHRILLDDLRRPEILDRLRKVWIDPMALDPSRETARVTREIAARLAKLARSLEQGGHPPEAVAQFLMRCLFTMFAEDINLLPDRVFRDVLEKYESQPDVAMKMLAHLWRDMDHGGFSAAIAKNVLQFNGKLFKNPDTLPLSKEQVQLLIEAAKADWKHVEPAIFGTLLERALTASERHKLGAHFTPRLYVERLVLPTIIEPLRTEWADAQAAAMTLASEGKQNASITVLRQFHHRLCNIRVLDPACGSGNFLYVTLEYLKRLEGEVLNALDEIGFRQTGLALGGERAISTAAETVDPHNLLGIELNPRAAAIAEIVLWIGYLQWHFRTKGELQPPQPIIRDFRNIENRDAILAYSSKAVLTDDQGLPVKRWDGTTFKQSQITGEQIPDESSVKSVEYYVNPEPASWPSADYIIGNPPYIGVRKLKATVGDQYVEAIRHAYPEVPETSDYVMYWWDKAARLVSNAKAVRFGLITTNSIIQSYSRRLLESHLGDGGKLRILFAIADHPWVDAADGAAVGVAMTVGGSINENKNVSARIGNAGESENDPVVIDEVVEIGPLLDAESAHTRIYPLKANAEMCFQGVVPAGAGFKIDPDEVSQWGIDVATSPVVRPYIIGKDLVQRPTERFIIDFFGLDESEARAQYPTLYQHIFDRVYPERRQNNRAAYRDKWWIFAEPRPAMRKAIASLTRFIVTPYTAKHRPFMFVDANTIPDAMAYAIASDEAWLLGVLSSSMHDVWATASGGTLEDRPRYNSKATFFPFPFPDLKEIQRRQIGDIAEKIDALRKRQQSLHPDLTVTGMYNVLDKLRTGQSLNESDVKTHEQGLISILRQLHDDLDAAVLSGYGWSDLVRPDSPGPNGAAQMDFEATMIERLSILNAERVAEEERGLIRWLRPAYQNPESQISAQADLDADGLLSKSSDEAGSPIKPKKWPKDTLDQVRAIADELAGNPAPMTIDQIAKRFVSRGDWKKRLKPLLEMLVALGRAQQEGNRYFGRRL